jgi:hypothetical protein
MSEPVVQKVREASRTSVDVGEVSLGDIDGAQSLVSQALLTGIAALSARGFSVAKIKLTLNAVSSD